MTPKWAEEFIGIPFLYGGRNIDGLDCWGLVRAVYQVQLDIGLPSYGEVSADRLREVARQMARDRDVGPWHAVAHPKPFDVVLMNIFGRGLPAHVGVMCSDADILHTEEGCNSVSVPLNHISVRSRIYGFRRHRNLM